MDLLSDKCKEYFIDTFLQHPIIYSTLVTFLIWLLPLYKICGGHWEWIALCLAIFELLGILVSIKLVPVLNIAPSYIILRPTPSCSTYDNPERYICLTLKNHQPVFYVTNQLPKPNDGLTNATKYYIISSWISSPGDLVTIEPVQFQPENSNGENKQAYSLPKGYGVQAAEPSGQDQQKVTFYSVNINGSTGILIPNSGFIDSSSLKKFESGWYRVSNCRCELTRWWYNRQGSHSEGYVDSYYVSLPQYTRFFLQEGGESTHAP